jgi:hypothetical protein
MKRILLILAILAGAFASHAQQPYQKINAYGYEWKRAKFDSSAVVPRDSLHLDVADSGSISYKNGCFYGWTGYRWGLIGCIAPAAPPLTITTQPVSQTVNTGNPVTFSVVAAGGTTPYTYQWFLNITPISGATSSTYSIGSASSGDAGNYNVVVTDAVSAFAISNTVVLTVNTPITVTYAYSSTDPYVDNSTAPTAGTTATTSISHNADLSITFPFAAENKFLWFKVPAAESTKVTWFVESLNNGTIPDVAFRAPFTVGGFTYYVTRDPAGFAFNSSLPVQLKQ